MAKLSGPEEFFEVFRQKQDEPAPRQEPPLTNQPAESRPAFDAADLTGKPSTEKTITVKASTALFAAVCVLLLMILSYFAGVAQRTPAKPESKKLPAVSRGTESGQQPPVVAPGRTVETGPRFELQTVSYNNNALGKKLAGEATKSLNDMSVVATSGARAYFYESGSKVIVAIGPFSSDRSLTAKQVESAVKAAPYAGQRPFRSAWFRPMAEGR